VEAPPRGGFRAGFCLTGAAPAASLARGWAALFEVAQHGESAQVRARSRERALLTSWT